MTEITVRKYSAVIQLPQEAIDDHNAMVEGMRQERERRAGLTQAEHDAEDQAWDERRAAEKAARTCQHCGCDPDEHGDY